ncbi:SDR family NAD(P)-dependent oxidoreductase [Streptomyces sp. ITFR-16]|uniref:SDR family NAD(P)-dependent oxidoreductase n=1 Tax=Streptomyces sp. ITFR-16 TaxID=3075198 RepID=UPI00288AD951|nr:SDR family NAD(P)-dependent oxidoreductase [Streptomyces sp. ITFR-16]WNI21430.1 SDR family NAD(P)-dependent oxidoreductase [Streptomyces sp. ITFR-16]
METSRLTVITGAAQGLGAAIAKGLAAPDRTLVLLDRSPAVKDVADALGAECRQAVGHEVDLGDGVAVTALTGFLTEEYGRCDILVNNAALSPKAPDGTRLDLADIPVEQWEQVLAVNLTAAFRLCAWALPLMKNQGWGRIVNMSSRAGRMYVPQAGAHYAATKAALIGFTRTVAGEGGPYGVTANCVAPGRIETPLTNGNPSGAAMGAAFVSQTPAARMGRPDEVSAAVEYLVSERAGFVTGAVIDVNGGVLG